MKIFNFLTYSTFLFIANFLFISSDSNVNTVSEPIPNDSQVLIMCTPEIPNFDIRWNDPVCRGDVVTFSIRAIPRGQSLTVVDWEFTGGLSEMSSNGKFAVAEATNAVPSTVCATVENSCGNTKEYCRSVNINGDSDCAGDGDIPNPK